MHTIPLDTALLSRLRLYVGARVRVIVESAGPEGFVITPPRRLAGVTFDLSAGESAFIFTFRRLTERGVVEDATRARTATSALVVLTEEFRTQQAPEKQNGPF